ncbi:hypothetical protein ACN9VK_10700 [Staphylococcus caprae]|uniref:hypothetical protein n=1 Tax=Staphylococcus caprae TaxID=29380 RepID=UPI003B21EEBD
MRKINKEGFIGKTKGIYTLVGLVNDTKGKFKCEICNKEYVANFSHWKYNGRNTCQCMFKDTHHKLYGRYDKMLYRCYNTNSDNYKYYGGRGIKVCKRWKTSFQNFLEDMQPTYFEGAELDRIDNDGNYEPSNCRWVTHSYNMLNRKGFKNSTNYPGVRITPEGTYLGRVQINKKEYRTKRFKNPKDAYNDLQKIKKRLYSEMNIE